MKKLFYLLVFIMLIYSCKKNSNVENLKEFKFLTVDVKYENNDNPPTINGEAFLFYLSGSVKFPNLQVVDNYGTMLPVLPDVNGDYIAPVGQSQLSVTKDPATGLYINKARTSFFWKEGFSGIGSLQTGISKDGQGEYLLYIRMNPYRNSISKKIEIKSSDVVNNEINVKIDLESK